MSRHLLLALLFSVSASSPDIQRWLRNVDDTRNAFEEAIIHARATQIVDGKPAGGAEFDIYTKGADRGVIVFRGGKNSGRRILTHGDRMWLIVPGASNPIPITPNQRLVGGASMGDVARIRFADDYTATLRPETEAVGRRTTRVLELRAKSPRSAYPRVMLWYDETERAPRQLRFFLSSGKAAKEVLFLRFDQKSGKRVVSEMEIRDLLSDARNTVTRLEYTEYTPAKLEERLFTPEGARGL